MKGLLDGAEQNTPQKTVRCLACQPTKLVADPYRKSFYLVKKPMAIVQRGSGQPGSNLLRSASMLLAFYSQVKIHDSRKVTSD
jgi:hypothetical protein